MTPVSQIKPRRRKNHYQTSNLFPALRSRHNHLLRHQQGASRPHHRLVEVQYRFHKLDKPHPHHRPVEERYQFHKRDKCLHLLHLVGHPKHHQSEDQHQGLPLQEALYQFDKLRLPHRFAEQRRHLPEEGAFHKLRLDEGSLKLP